MAAYQDARHKSSLSYLYVTSTFDVNKFKMIMCEVDASITGQGY